MLIFTDIREFKELMLTQFDDLNFYEFNLSSLYQCGTNLANLLPNPDYIPEEVISGSLDTPEFDIAYGNFIIQNDVQFMTLLSIMTPLYNDPLACVIIYFSRSPVRDAIMESLIKLIQQRYGYNPYIVSDYEDIMEIKDNSSFSVRGIVQIQEDNQRLILLGAYGAIPSPYEDYYE